MTNYASDIPLRFHTSCKLDEAKLMKLKRCPCKTNCSNDVDCDRVFHKIECPPNCHKDCQNQKFRLCRFKENIFLEPKNGPLPEVEVRNSEVSGRGLHASENIKNGRMIMAYTGDVIDQEERKIREKKYRAENLPNYFFEAGTLIIDPTKYGNKAKYANHSCNPNMIAESWSCHGTPDKFKVIVFVACRDIKKGEELTINYGRAYANNMPCTCNATVCSGLVGKTRNAVVSKKKKMAHVKKAGPANVKKTKTTVSEKKKKTDPVKTDQSMKTSGKKNIQKSKKAKPFPIRLKGNDTPEARPYREKKIRTFFADFFDKYYPQKFRFSWFN